MGANLNIKTRNSPNQYFQYDLVQLLNFIKLKIIHKKKEPTHIQFSTKFKLQHL